MSEQTLNPNAEETKTPIQTPEDFSNVWGDTDPEPIDHQRIANIRAAITQADEADRKNSVLVAKGLALPREESEPIHTPSIQEHVPIIPTQSNNPTHNPFSMPQDEAVIYPKETFEPLNPIKPEVTPVGGGFLLLPKHMTRDVAITKPNYVRVYVHAQYLDISFTPSTLSRFHNPQYALISYRPTDRCFRIDMTSNVEVAKKMNYRKMPSRQKRIRIFGGLPFSILPGIYELTNVGKNEYGDMFGVFILNTNLKNPEVSTPVSTEETA